MAKASKKEKYLQLPSFDHHQQRKNHKKIWILTFSILIVAAVTILINLFQPISFPNKENTSISNDAKTETSNNSTTKNTATPASSKQTDNDNSTNESKLIKEKTPSQYEGSSANSSENLTGSISYLDTSTANNLSVRVNIDQSLEDGTCILHLLQGLRDNYYEAGIILSASTSTCRGFDIDTSELPSGEYDIRIDLESSGKTGTINGKVTL